MSSRSVDRFVADGASEWLRAADRAETLQQIEVEVRSRHRAELERAGRFEQILVEWRIRREIAAERARVTLETLWAQQ